MTAPLRPWLETVRSQAHVLTRHPEMLLQQFANESRDPDAAAQARARLLSRGAIWLECRGSSMSPDQSLARLSHTGRVFAVAFVTSSTDPRDELIVTGDDAGDLRLWDPVAGRELRRWPAHKDGVRRIVATGDGRYVATAGGDSTVRVWDTWTWSEVRSQRIDWRTVDLAASRVSHRIAIVDGGSAVRILDVDSGDVGTIETQNWIAIGAVALAPDERTIAAGCGDGLVFVLDPASGRPLRKLTGHTETITCVACSPDGAWLASGSRTGELFLWNAAGDGRRLTGHRDAVTGLAFSPDSVVLFSASFDESVRTWSVASGTALTSTRAHGERVAAVAVAQSGELAASGGADRQLVLWDARALARPSERATIAHEDLVCGAAVSGDGQRVVTASWDGTVIEWDAETCAARRRIAAHADKVAAIAVSTDGSRACSGGRDGVVQVWDLEAGSLVKTLKFRSYQGWVNAVALTSDLLLAGTERGVLAAWNAHTLRASWERGVSMDGVRSLAVTPQSDRVVIGGFGAPFLAAGGLQARAGIVGATAVSRDAVVITRDDHVDAVAAVAVSPDAAWFVSAGWDGSLARRDPATAAVLARWNYGRGPLYTLAVSADGRLILVGGIDRMLRLVDADTGVDLARFCCRGEVRACCTWARDGALMAAAGDSTGAVYFLRVHGVGTMPHRPGATAQEHTPASRPWWKLGRR